MGYKNRRGIVGNWKGKQVNIIEKKDYEMTDENMIYVIADDGMKMVKGGYVIGILNDNGSVMEVNGKRYLTERTAAVTSTFGEDDFYKKYSKTVDEFFNRTYDPIIILE
ncbi:MAG: hypothetical protein J6R67_03745 [Treponema sp.]|nr:hypothetical protein [Treponema sp.]